MFLFQTIKWVQCNWRKNKIREGLYGQMNEWKWKIRHSGPIAGLTILYPFVESEWQCLSQWRKCTAESNEFILFLTYREGFIKNWIVFKACWGSDELYLEMNHWLVELFQSDTQKHFPHGIKRTCSFFIH